MMITKPSNLLIGKNEGHSRYVNVVNEKREKQATKRLTLVNRYLDNFDKNFSLNEIDRERLCRPGVTENVFEYIDIRIVPYRAVDYLLPVQNKY